MSRATTDSLDALHGLLSDAMRDQLQAYRDARDELGVPLPIPPAFLAQCIKFLKDNGIDSPARAVKLMDTLRDAMPDFDDDAGYQPGAAH